MLNEEWRSIIDYEGYYEISSFGNVRSLDRAVSVGSQIINLKGRIKAQTPDKDGYKTVHLSKNGKKSRKKVHRLVLEAFVGPSELLACHKNGRPSDNRLSNLYWGNESDNQNDCIEHGTNCNAKLQEDDIRTIHKLYANGYTQKAIAEIFHIDATSICRILSGKTYKRWQS